MADLFLGAQIVFTGANLFFCFIGVVIGTLIGVLPGIGPAGTIALLLPVTYGLDPVSAIIMLSGVYYGAMYGGSTTSILVNVPGEAASIVTTLDGYQMARNGRAGPALGISAIGSFVAGTASVVLLSFLGEPLSLIALKFGPPEFFSLMIFALICSSFLSRGSIIKALIMVALGLGLSQIGTDMISGHVRFTFGIIELEDGISLVPLVMGLFGVSEVLKNIGELDEVGILKEKIQNIFPSVNDLKKSFFPIVRGTFLGFFLGVLPGGGAIIASFMSYALEKRISKYPEKFGTGVIEGVAGPESANNSASTGAFIPLFILGIPSNPVMALLLGALMIHGLQPGPLLVHEHPGVFWGTIVSMYVGNVILIILNLPMIGLWVKLLQVPYRIVFPMILFFCVIGAYSINNQVFDVILMVTFGIIGNIFSKHGYEPAPLVIAFVLGPMMSTSLGQSLLMFRGDLSLFITRPISGLCLAAALFFLVASILWSKRTIRISKIISDD